MKRKADVSDLPTTKKARIAPERVVLTLLKEQGKNVTMAHLQNAIPKLSIEVCSELLQQLKDNQELDLPGAPFLIKDLFVYLFTQDYTDSSIIELCNLLFDYKNCQKLPTFRGRIYNNWLKNFEPNIASNLQNFPRILRILGQIVSSGDVDFAEEIDSIDIDFINNYLLKITEKTPENLENFAELRLSIICAVELLSQGENFKGQLNTAYMNKLLALNPNEMPDPEELGTIVFHLEYLITRGIFSQSLSTALLEEYLVLIIKNADIETSSKKFSTFVPVFANQRHYRHEPFKAEALQLLIDRIINSDLESWKLGNFLIQLGRLIKANLVQGEIHDIEKILEKIKIDEVDAGMICKIFMTLSLIIPQMKNPIPTWLVQKFLVEKLHSDKKLSSTVFNTIYNLADRSKLTGVFTVDFFEHVNFYANKQTSDLDSRLIEDLLGAIAACLRNGQIDFFLHSELLEKLLEHFSHMKLDKQNITHISLAIKNIANSKKYKGVFQGKMFDDFLQILLTKQTVNSLSTCLYASGIVARKGYLAGTIAQNTIERVLNTLLNFPDLRPIYVLKCFTAISDLMAKNALKLDEKKLEETIYEILLNTNFNNRDYLNEVHVSDIRQILQLPNPLSGKILHKFLPIWLDILNSKPDIAVIKEIFNALDTLAKSQHRPKISTKYIQDLFAVFLKIDRKYTLSVLNAFGIIVDLAEMKSLDGNLDLNRLEHPLLEVCDEQLKDQRLMNIELSDIASLLEDIDCLESSIQLLGEIDILPRIMELIDKNIYQTQIVDITSIAEIFYNIQNLVEKKIIVKAINKYDFMDDILEAVLSVPDLNKENIISILNGLCCLIEYKLYNGCIDASLIFSLFLKLQSFDSNELSMMYYENLHFLLEDKYLYSKSIDFQQPTPSQTLRHLFFQPAKASTEDQHNCKSALTSPSSIK